MGKHFIFPDTHHLATNVVNHLEKKAKKEGGKVAVSSTGDFCVYKANASGPDSLSHPFLDAYKNGDKEGMKKHETAWGVKVAEDTPKNGAELQRLKPYLKGGKVSAVIGNSDVGVAGIMKKASGKSLKELLGGSKSAVQQKPGVKVKTQDNTAFVYMSHDAGLASRFKDKDYATVKAALAADSSYQAKLKGITGKVTGSDNVVVMMHESPKPEKWYSGAKVKQRLPDPLRAHYDSVLEHIAKANPDKKIDVFHGHLHEETADYKWKTNTSNLSNVNVHNLNIDAVVEYDTITGKHKIEKAGKK
jgi:hypothetical protein